MKTFLLVLGYLVALSTALCVVLVIRKHFALRKAEQFEGSVINHVARRGSKGGTTYALTIAYNDRNGEPHEFTTRSGSNPPSRDIGAKVTVFHHANGAKPDILVFQELYLGYWIWFCFAACIAGCLAGSHLISRLYLGKLA